MAKLSHIDLLFVCVYVCACVWEHIAQMSHTIDVSPSISSGTDLSFVEHPTEMAEVIPGQQRISHIRRGVSHSRCEDDDWEVMIATDISVNGAVLQWSRSAHYWTPSDHLDVKWSTRQSFIQSLIDCWPTQESLTLNCQRLCACVCMCACVCVFCLSL